MSNLKEGTETIATKAEEGLQFANLHRHTGLDSVLFAEEQDVLLGIIRFTLEAYAPHARHGTFILDGQKQDNNARCILRFNLPAGTYERQLSGTVGRDSDTMAEESIDELLAIPGESRYTSGNSTGRRVLRHALGKTGNLHSGIWQDEELQALVLNSANGRFLASCFVDGADGEEAAEAVLYAVAQTLAWLSPEDATLQKSAQIVAIASDSAKVDPLRAYQYIEAAFASCSEPTMQAWKSWRDAIARKGRRKLFFE